MANSLGRMRFYVTGHHSIWKFWACEWFVSEADQSPLYPSDYKVEGTDHSSIENTRLSACALAVRSDERVPNLDGR